MKTMIAFLIAFGALAFGQNPVPPDTKKSTPIRIEPFDPDGLAFAEKIYDFVLTNTGTTGDTVIGNVFDIRKLALVRHYEGDTATNIAVMDSLLAQATISCYDLADSAAVTDSVNFQMILQGSDFAANNSDPGTPHSDAWYTIRSFTTTDVSANSAQVTTDTLKIKLPLLVHSPQFIRVYGANLSEAAQNDMRCRVFLYRPRWAIH